MELPLHHRFKLPLQRELLLHMRGEQPLRVRRLPCPPYVEQVKPRQAQ